VILIRQYVCKGITFFPFTRKRNLINSFVAFGKAASPMARALADGVGEKRVKEIVITTYDHVDHHSFADNVAVYEAGHPLPDENGMMAAGEVLKLLQEADQNSLVIFLISGGGSALLARPYAGVSLEEKQMVTGLLLKAGANINELNAVRKHISAVKGE
jgi:glycerate-2-kinase